MQSKRVEVLWRAIFLLMFLAATIVVSDVPANAAGPDDPAELEAFLDGFLASAMEQYHVPGLVFVMVKNGRVFLAKGYGYADLATGRRVDPETTLFRVASVSKLFTGTAIMQLAEQGKLDLHTDVNVYLKSFQLPETFSEPVTPLHLVTHTAGFNERVFGMAARRREDVRPLGEYLADRMPRRVLPPGDVFSYSNHGVALAGLLIEEISGVPFAKYIEDEILEPLGMSHSSFILTPEMAPDLAQGYYYQDYEYQLAPYDYSNDAPAGSLITSGAEISGFMLAHLQDGRLGDARILSEETARLMHTQQFTHHPKLPGCAYSFMEDFINGRRLIGHGGNWRGYTTRLVMDFDADMAFFLSYNALSSAGTENGLHIDLVDAFYDRYFPVPKASLPAPPANAIARAGQFVGSYRHNRLMRDSFGKLAALLSEWQVTANADGSLTAHLPSDYGGPVRLVEVEPLLFLRGDGKGYIAFRADVDGRVTHMFVENYAADKLLHIESSGIQILLLSGIMIIFLSAVIGWPTAYLLRKPRPSHPAGAQVARWCATVMAILFVGSLAFIAGELSGETYEYSYGVPAKTAFLLKLNYLNAALVVAVAVFAFFAWRKGWWGLAARIHFSIIALAAVALIPILIYWRLLGYGY
jgi:CubicO group peptidase (beta-lactamase class C family)